jgi:hypothetical protein
MERKSSSGTFQQIGATAFFYAMGFVSTNFSLLYGKILYAYIAPTLSGDSLLICFARID